MSSLEADNVVPQTPGLLAMDAEPIHLPLGVVIENLVKVRYRLLPFHPLFSYFLLFADITWSIGAHDITLKKWANFVRWPKQVGVLVHATKLLQNLFKELEH